MQAGKDILGKVVCETGVEIKNADGLHMRPAMQFVDIANRFECDITVSNNENRFERSNHANERLPNHQQNKQKKTCRFFITTRTDAFTNGRAYHTYKSGRRLAR
jgi:hypothetical protein